MRPRILVTGIPGHYTRLANGAHGLSVSYAERQKQPETKEDFLQELRNISNTLAFTVELGLVALPMTLLMTSGEFDLSVGSVFGFSAVVMWTLFNSGLMPMGAAFLLLETKNIATFALLFGTTWLVNALVFAGVLLVVLAAVEVTRRFRTPPLPVVFGGIAAALLVAYLVPPDALLPLPFWPRLLVAVLLAFVPIYLANVAFAKRFGASDDSRAAFGLNLLGAMLGGTMEYLALLTGYRNLLLIVAALYLCAFLLTPRKGLVTV